MSAVSSLSISVDPVSIDIGRLVPPPAGFGNCAKCAYREDGAAAVCHACAAVTIQSLNSTRCGICEQALDDETDRCRNFWCTRQLGDHTDEGARQFENIYAIAQMSGVLERKIKDYKYAGRRAWAGIFGRVLLGHFEERAADIDKFGAIVANPTYIGPGGRAFDHTQQIIEKAKIEDLEGRWPLAVGPHLLLTKNAKTKNFATMSGSERRLEARTSLRAALQVIDPAAVAGRSILVFDDVFTDGSTLNEVARTLRQNGAISVSGIVLARQPWRESGSSPS